MILDQIKNGWKQLKNHVRQQARTPGYDAADSGQAVQNPPAKTPGNADNSAARPQFYSQKIMPLSQQKIPLRCERVPAFFSARDVHRCHNPYLGG